MRYVILLLSLVVTFTASAQKISLKNPSFEGIPKQGHKHFYLLSWYDCGVVFKGETPPDIHPIKDGLWGNFKRPNHGTTYVGLVTRDNDTYEGISQKLVSPIQADQCYSFSISIARNDTYLSGSRKQSQNDELDFKAQRKVVPYTQPIVLRIWGGDKYGEEQQLLAESKPIDHNDWMKYEFNFKPEKDFRYFTLSAFYKVPTLETYNGHILIDNASDIIPVACPRELDIYPTQVVNVDKAKKKDVVSPRKPKKPVVTEEPVVIPRTPKPEIPSEDVVVTTPKKKKPQTAPTINKDLGKKVKKGQIINIKNLLFEMDDSSIQASSYGTLDELYYFLESNPNVKIEVGGHTNGIPAHDFCDKLSQERANAVSNYLIGKGINSDRIKAVGYGKRKPIASNRTLVGRRRNQRVEIKILDL